MVRSGSKSLTAISMILGSLLLLGAFSEGAVPEKSKRFTESGFFDLEFAVAPEISPDGNKIIYVRQARDIMADRRYSNLWMINFDGTDPRPLTTGRNNYGSCLWSPDGRRIIFISDRDGSSQIYQRWMDTGQTVQLTNLQFPPLGVSWSPDGKYISFTSFVPGPPLAIGKPLAAPPGAKWADPPLVIDKAVYRFDGVGYYKPGYWHIFVIPAEGGTPRQISSGNFHHGGLGFSGAQPVWTPDGKYLLISANRKEDYEYEPAGTEIYEFSVADGTCRALTNRKGPDADPVISRDGKFVAYLGFDDRYQGYQVSQLYVVNRDGSQPRLLSGKLDRDVAQLNWASDGSGVYFLYDDQGNTKLGFSSMDGSLKQLTGNIGGLGTAYGRFARYYSVSNNGRFAFTYTRPDVPGEIAVMSLDNRTVKVITAVNEDILARTTLGQVEEIWYTSSLDKRKIQGWIIKPPDFNPAKKYPLILEIHGGPFANYGDRFDVEKQIMAAHDYVVLYTNPRGSTSYGQEFGNLIHQAYPGDDFYDLNSGVDAVMAKGYIDPENLFVTGGSGGGVLTCWMIGRTERFRAAVSQFPVVNWYSFSLTADMYTEAAKYWFPGFPWDYAEHYLKRSPISLVKNVKTPTVIMTGEQDLRTPMSESEQYYQALKLLKVESVLVRVPGESHGIGRYLSHSLAKTMTIINWFDQHKKKP